MQFQLVTLAGLKLDEAVYEVILPTTEGVISVFPSHEALVTVAIPGVVTVRRHKEDRDDELEYFAISGGVVEINQERVRILVDEAEHGDDIIEAESPSAGRSSCGTVEGCRAASASTTTLATRDLFAFS